MKKIFSCIIILLLSGSIQAQQSTAYNEEDEKMTTLVITDRQ